MVKRALILSLVVGTACSAQGSAPFPPQPTEATRPLPKDAPLNPAIKDVPATSGKANLPLTPPDFTITTIGRFSQPSAIAFLPDGSLLVTERTGNIELRTPDGGLTKIGGVPDVARGGQAGLLDVAIAPDFSVNHIIYLSFAESGAGGSGLALARATLDIHAVQCVRAPCPPQAQLSNLFVLWRSGSNGPGLQFGANILFAPDGKYLFLSSGERQRFTPAQDPDQLLGKILRLTLDGKAAPGNPMAAAGGVRAMTWSTGHRNPYGMVFAPDGRLWEEEMGPRGGDELNLILPGKNYGWPIVSNGDNYSGLPIPDHPSRPDLEAPKLWWDPSISPSGMIYYSGAMFPTWRGSLLIATLSGKALIRVAVDGASARAADQWNMGTRIRDIAQAPDGSVWLLEDDGPDGYGKLMRLTPKT